MSSLYHTLNIGAQSLYANRQGVDTAGHNIANAQTEGYSRQRVNIKARTPSEKNGIVIGNGAYAESISRTNDSFIEKQLNYAMQSNGYSKGLTDALTGLEQIYSPEMQNSVSDEITSFFNSLEDLSTYPDEIPIRTNVRENAKNVISSFQRVDRALVQQQNFMNDKIEGMAANVNGLLTEIAEINSAIMTLEAGREGQANDLRDQQDRLVRTLSKNMDIEYYNNDSGNLVIRGPDQTLLMERGYAAEIATTVDENTGFLKVVAYDPSSESIAPRDLTPHFENGELKGALEVRDRVVPNLIQRNHKMAREFADQINTIHRQGYGIGDFSEKVGRDFFEIPDFSNAAARDIKLSESVSEDVNAISAAATPNAPGDNVILNQIIGLGSKPVLDGETMTFNEYYADYVGLVGLEVQRAKQEQEADGVLLADLSSRREAISGVSLDEEAVNLLRWQTAFAASSKVITTIDEMLETVLSIKR